MRYVVMTLAALGAIGSGLYAGLAMLAQGMSDAPGDASGAADAGGAAIVCAICVAIFWAAWS